MSTTLFPLPTDLVAPIDDGACAHLTGLPFPDLALPSATDASIRHLQPPSALAGDEAAAIKTVDFNLYTLSKACEGTEEDIIILFCYPRTAKPGESVPKEWDDIPGARGCTPQNCSYRDALPTLLSLHIPPTHLFSLSTQPAATQLELHTRLNLPYNILSDHSLHLVDALKLPTFEWEGARLVKRVTMAIRGGEIVRVWYPVFPSDRNVGEVVEWLREVRGRKEV